MAKIRGIKPDTWTDAKFVRLTPLARLLFIGLWNLACDNGHVEDDPVQLKIRLLPMDNTDIDELIDEMVQTGQVERHPGFLKVVKLPEHQHIDLYWLTLCEHCNEDSRSTFSEADKKGRKSGKSLGQVGIKSGTSLAPDYELRGDELRGDELSGYTSEADASDPPLSTGIVSTQERPEVNAICEHLVEAIAANGSKRPTITKRWRDAARLMLDKDGRTLDEVHGAIDWCQRDEFWRANVLSLPTLREKYDQLRLQAQRTPRAATGRTQEWQQMQERQMARAIEREREMGLR